MVTPLFVIVLPLHILKEGSRVFQKAQEHSRVFQNMRTFYSMRTVRTDGLKVLSHRAYSPKKVFHVPDCLRILHKLQ